MKVFAKNKTGEGLFYKDGYTDLRGKFDYATISGNSGKLSEIEKFAIFVTKEG